MTSRTLLRRLALVVCAGGVMLLAAHAFRFDFKEADSDLYSRISEALAQEPLSAWMQPQWPPAKQKTGLFEEHLAVFFWPSALLGVLGPPRMDAALLVNACYVAAFLVVLWLLVRRLMDDLTAHAAVLMWILSPAPSTYILRANHESALALGVAAAWLGLELAGTQAWGALLLAAGAVWCVLIKGVVGLMVIPALGLWWLLRGGGQRRLLALCLALFAVGVALWAYDLTYARVQGYSFLERYLDIQMGHSTLKEGTEAGGLKLKSVGFYAINVVWGLAPWSLVMLVRAVRGRKAGIASPAFMPALACVAFYVLALSLFGRTSIRYIYSALVFMAVACAPWVAGWERLRGFLIRGRPWLPEVWTGLALMTLLGRLYIHAFHYRYVGLQD